jgi:hypothetical protein
VTRLQEKPSVDADHISPKEWRWALAWALTIVAVSCLPYLVAWIATPPGYQFGGILVNPLDGNSYLAKMRQGWAGAWQFHLTYTPEPHDGADIFLFYLGLGHLARWTGLPLLLVYHGARVLAGLALLLTIYAFAAHLTGDLRERRLVAALASTAAGLGWLGAALGTSPIDLSVPEAFAFFSLLTNPHFPLALALMLAVVMEVVWPAAGLRRWAAPGLAGLALAVIQPFALGPLYVAIAFYLLLRGWLDRAWPRSELVAAASAVAFSTPPLLYDAWVYTTNPALSAWAAQNVTPAPPLLDLVLGCGLVGLLAVAGGIAAVRGRDRGGLALLAWSVGTLLLVYAPFALQRRFLTGLGLPLAMLAALGVPAPLGLCRRGRLAAPRGPGSRWLAGRLAALVVGFSALGNLFLLLILTLGTLAGQQQPALFARLYLSQDEAAAMQWLLANAPGEVVLAAPRTGMLLPGWAGVRAFAGHPFETIDAKAKQAQAEAFFRGELSPAEWQALREQYHIRYVFVGPAERALGDGLPTLDVAFRRGDVTIYR